MIVNGILFGIGLGIGWTVWQLLDQFLAAMIMRVATPIVHWMNRRDARRRL